MTRGTQKSSFVRFAVSPANGHPCPRRARPNRASDPREPTSDKRRPLGRSLAMSGGSTTCLSRSQRRRGCIQSGKLCAKGRSGVRDIYIYIFFSIWLPSAGRCPHLTALRGSRREIFEVDDICRSCGSDMWLASGHHHYDVAALSDTTRGKRKPPLSGKRTSNGPPKK